MPVDGSAGAVTRQLETAASRQFTAIFDQLTDGFFSLDANWRFTYINPAALAALRVGDGVLGREIWQVFPEARETIFEEEFRRAMASRATTEFESFYPANLVWLRVNAFPLDDGLAVCIADVTQMRKARQKLVELNLELRERSCAYNDAKAFAETLAHDLLQPLAALSAFSEALSATAVDELGPSSAHYLRKIQRAAKHLDAVSKAILLLCGIGRGEMKYSPVDIGEIATECVEVLRAAHPDREFECSIASGMWVSGDPGLLRVALQNLLSNAWKFTSRERMPRIEVGTAQGPDNEILHFVRDNGVGFDAAEAVNVFQPFRRLHGDAFGGDGIGLATVKSIIDRHGGRIWAVAGLDQGATFYFTFPTGALCRQGIRGNDIAAGKSLH